ncbi:lysophospholipid acyltransferase family protein [Bacillus sp. B-jedd]|uniref:lysophospholipid acyltransferase family protein n=1 Tax=Bacillus sp. B-jedd TaxID=1476857 RepID=UPI000515598E|nr:lysophospholipid acyltransferase family protein [Bacillus sp. B-jedd]CEG27258.1 putative 1-acyl-sn-glycerol-3-phosphate acyltransferase [Bacillus sp. B-jedd]
MYQPVGYSLKGVLRVFSKTKVYNKEVLPKSGGYVIACTHTGWVDVLALGTAVLPIEIHYMAKKQLFQNRLFGWTLGKLNAFPVDRDNPGPSVLKIPQRLLAKGEVVGIFPSGTRIKEQAELKQGAITIAMRSQVPIIPAAYSGPNTLKELFSFKKSALVFGEPILIPSSAREDRDTYTHLLEEKMNELQRSLN